MPDEFFTVPEVAQRLRQTVKFIRSEIRRGRLQANLMGGEYRILESYIEAYIELTRTGQQSKDEEEEEDLLDIGA